jgi:hypothetical protein
MLMRIFGPKREGMVRGLGRLHNEEPQNLYTIPNIVQVIKSRRLSWAAHVVCKGEM